MKKLLLSLFLFIGLSSFAQASTGLYLKGGVGYGFLKDADAIHFYDLTERLYALDDDNFTNHWALDVALGYDFNRFLGLEANYQYYFKSSNEISAANLGVLAKNNVMTDAHKVFLFAVLKAPIMEKVTLFGKVGPGYSWHEKTYEHDDWWYASVYNEDSMAWGYGAGAELALNEKLGVSVEYLGSSFWRSVNSQGVFMNMVWHY